MGRELTDRVRLNDKCESKETNTSGREGPGRRTDWEGVVEVGGERVRGVPFAVK